MPRRHPRAAVAAAALCAAAPCAAYRAAVVEYAPRIAPGNNASATAAAQLMLGNLDGFEAYISAAKANGTQIIVFPEYGIVGDGTGRSDNTGTWVEWTRDGVAPFCEQMPDVDPTGPPPCGASAAGQYPVTAAASCLARKYSIVLVIDLLDTQPCAACPGGRGQYNTAAAFDEEGRLIAKYHKHHLYGKESKYLDVGPSTNGTRFQTSFGVEFGMFICFDITQQWLPDPALRHFAFPTDWVNLKPLETALEAQRAWTGLHGVSMLASNYGGFGKESSGSGIWVAGRDLVSFFNPTEVPQTRMLVADVPQ